MCCLCVVGVFLGGGGGHSDYHIVNSDTVIQGVKTGTENERNLLAFQEYNEVYQTEVVNN